MFSIQVQQPWLLLQLDDSNKHRRNGRYTSHKNVDLSVSPDENKRQKSRGRSGQGRD